MIKNHLYLQSSPSLTLLPIIQTWLYHFKNIKKNLMKKGICELPGCEKDIPAWRHGNATTCCDEHGELLKKARDAAYYQKVRNTALPIIKLREYFNDLANKFGFEVPIDLNYVSPLKIDWSIKTGSFYKDGAMGVALGDIGYMLYQPHFIKIFKL